MTKTTTKSLAAISANDAGRKKHRNSNRADQLSDLQLVALSAACQRDDRTIAIPKTLADPAIPAFASNLIQLGLAEEATAAGGQSVWRQDEDSGQPVTLRITGQALIALGIDEGDAGKRMDDAEMAVGVRKVPAANRTSAAGSNIADPAKVISQAPKAATAAPGANATIVDIEIQAGRAQPPQPRAGSKQSQLVAMLAREEGASIAEIATALGWLPHTTRAALTGLCHKGHELGREVDGERGSLYRITAMPIMAPAMTDAAQAEAA